MAVMTAEQTIAFPTAVEGYDRGCVDAALEAERAWRAELEQRAAALLKEAAALHLAIAMHAPGTTSEAAEPAVSPEEEKRRAAAERRRVAAAAKKEAAAAEESKARQAEEKRKAAAERRRVAAAAKREAAAAEQQADAAERAVREEIERTAAEVAAMKEELERMRALHQSSSPAVPAQPEPARTIPPAAAAFAASAGAAWARRTSESATIRRSQTDVPPRPTENKPAVTAPAAVSIPLVPALPAESVDVPDPKQEVPAARTGGKFSSKRIVLRRPAAPLEDAGQAPAVGNRFESRIIRLG